MCLIKFNDYFEFPRELDMEPYTVGGLAKIEGEAVDCDPSDLDGRQVRKYRYVIFGAQSFTSLKADLRQDIKRGFAFSRCFNGTFP